MTFGEKIVDRRNKCGLTQGELAERVGISRSSLCNIEKDKNEPKFIDVICLADVLGVSLDYLAGKEKG